MKTSRPAELTALFAIAAAVYGWLTERGVPDPFAAVIGLAAGTVPLAVSTFKDFQRDDPQAKPELPKGSSKHERHELTGVSL